MNETITKITFVEVYEMELVVDFDTRKPRMKLFGFCRERKVMNELNMFMYMETLVSPSVLPVSSQTNEKYNDNTE